MKSETGESQSLWMATADVPARKPLDASAEADVCIIGAGIAGLSTAYFLAKAGKTVVVLDDGPIAGGQTRRTTAHLANALDDRYYEIERCTASEAARLAAESHTAAIDRIETDRRRGERSTATSRGSTATCSSPGDSTETELDKELDAAHTRRADARREARAARRSRASTPGRCLRFPGQAQFHPLKYLAGLAAAIERDGGQIFTETPRRERSSGGRPAKVHDRGRAGRHRRRVVVATNTPINDLVAIHTKQAPYLTYVDRRARAAGLDHQAPLLGHRATPTTTSGSSRLRGRATTC